MRRFTTLTAVVLIAGAALLATAPAPADAQVLMRHVAEWRFGAEQFALNTAVAFPGVPDGDPIYLKTFNLPPDQHTVFVTLSTTGDAHEGVSHWFSARINGQPCSPGNGGAALAPNGWISLQKHFDYDPPVTYTTNGMSGLFSGDGGGGTGDMHDNGIYYTWCCLDAVVPGAPNRVEIRMATSNPNTPVFVERSHYYIDSVDLKLCNQADPVPVGSEGDPTEEEEHLLENANPGG